MSGDRRGDRREVVSLLSEDETDSPPKPSRKRKAPAVFPKETGSPKRAKKKRDPGAPKKAEKLGECYTCSEPVTKDNIAAHIIYENYKNKGQVLQCNRCVPHGNVETEEEQARRLEAAGDFYYNPQKFWKEMDDERDRNNDLNNDFQWGDEPIMSFEEIQRRYGQKRSRRRSRRTKQRTSKRALRHRKKNTRTIKKRLTRQRRKSRSRRRTSRLRAASRWQGSGINLLRQIHREKNLMRSGRLYFWKSDSTF